MAILKQNLVKVFFVESLIKNLDMVFFQLLMNFNERFIFDLSLKDYSRAVSDFLEE